MSWSAWIFHSFSLLERSHLIKIQITWALWTLQDIIQVTDNIDVFDCWSGGQNRLNMIIFLGFGRFLVKWLNSNKQYYYSSRNALFVLYIALARNVSNRTLINHLACLFCVCECLILLFLSLLRVTNYEISNPSLFNSLLFKWLINLHINT